MKRRDFLTSAPVALIGCTASASASCARSLNETPVARAYRKWAAFRAHVIGPATKGMRSAEFDPLVDDLDDMGRDLLLIPSQTPQDFILKVIASTDWGQGAMPREGEMPDLWAEARALVEAPE